MMEITVLSGKGGTGKTTITAALASVASHTVFCDNDVDAADLHLILKPDFVEVTSFRSGYTAVINVDKCSNCIICQNHCRFDAIFEDNEQLKVNPYKCEGCRLCERVCPEHAISALTNDNNYWYVSNTRFGTMVHAKMQPGEENSGKLVTTVRTKTQEIARETNAHFILNDGPPGIGCATISSLTGTNRVLMIIEPTKSGLHDAERLLQLVNSFGIPVFAVINKYDLNVLLSHEVEIFLKENGVDVLTKIPFNKDLVNSMIQGKTIVEYSPDSEIAALIKELWMKITH